MQNQIAGKQNTNMTKYGLQQHPSQPVNTLNAKPVKQVKAAYWQPRASLKNETSMVMVPCLNCEELIHVDQIDRHSLKCTSVSKNVVAVGKSTQMFDEIDFKILKLKDSLKQIVDQVKQKEIPQKGSNELTEKKLKYLCRACEIADAVRVVQSLGPIEERRLRDVEEELRILSEGYQGSLGIALYMERLHSLILQKLSVFKRQQQNQRGRSDRNRQEEPSWTLQQNKSQENFFPQRVEEQQRSNSRSKYSVGSSQTTTKDQLKTLIIEKKQEVTQIKNMAQFYQQRTQTSQQMINNVMNINVNNYLQQPNQLKSPTPQAQDLSSSRYLSPDMPNGRPTLITKFSGSYDRSQQQDPNQKSEILTQLSSSQWDSEVAHMEDYQNIQQFQSTGDQLQRIFYSKCLNQKMKLPSNHPSQKIPVSVLFKEACSKKIPQGQWDQFISQALQSPYEYLDMNKIANYNNSKLVKNNLREMTQDSQFKNRLHHL